MDELWKNNVVELCGIVAEKPAFSHKSKDEEYLIFPMEVERLSGVIDRINILARRELLEDLTLESRGKLYVHGEMRSFNNKTGKGNRLVITVFARELLFSDDEDENKVFLNGVLCKPPNLRKTPMGREICDLMLAVGRRYGRSDYLPCIAWGQNAAISGEWDVGTAVELKGRVQSRNYIKIEDGVSIQKTAYEISIMSIQEVNNDT